MTHDRDAASWAIGDTFEAVLVETFSDGRPWPRVRPVAGGLLSSDLKIEFPKKLRSEYPLGAQFRVDLKVAQKYNRAGPKAGQPRGGPYLVANVATIRRVAGTPAAIAESVRPAPPTIATLRAAAIAAARRQPAAMPSQSTRHQRSEVVARYVRARADGQCEACGGDAPFTHRNGEPYLEVHHLDGLAAGGADAPDTTAAICPNCHTRVTVGDDREAYNAALAQRVRATEEALDAR